MHLARILVEAGKNVPNASVFHYHNERWSQILRRYDRESIALRSIMPEIMVHWYDALRYFFAAVMSDTSKAIAEKEFWRRIGEINAFRLCQFYGAWRGNRLHRRLSKREKERYFYPN